jgi:peptidoglycan hydrolase CwlO-like protein
MSLVGKIFAVLCLVLAVFYAGITASLLTLQENYKRQLAQTEQRYKDIVKVKDTKIDDLESMKQGLEKQVDNLQKGLARSQGENNELRAEWAIVSAALQHAKNIIDDQEAAIKSLDKNRADLYNDLVAKGETIKKRDGEITEFKGKLDATGKRRDEFQDLLTEREKQLVNAEKELARVTDALKYRTDKLDILFQKRPEVWKEIMEAGSGVEGGGMPIDKNIRGKVVGVDKKLGFVILNVGQKQGVQKGYSFVVFRDAEYVGKVIVQDVTTPDTCAARYDKPLMKTDAEVGDDVALRLMVEF